MSRTPRGAKATATRTFLAGMLDENSPYEFGVVEDPEAGADDDGTLYTKAGAGKPDKFIPIKWHVDHQTAHRTAGWAIASP